jgi:transcriptional regulator with XRE-family HTH domain
MARERAGLTQEDLAREVGLTRTSITNIERGRQKLLIHALFAIAQALGVPAVSLLPPSLSQGSSSIEVGLADDLPAPEREWVKRVLMPDGGAQ